MHNLYITKSTKCLEATKYQRGRHFLEELFVSCVCIAGEVRSGGREITPLCVIGRLVSSIIYILMDCIYKFNYRILRKESKSSDGVYQYFKPSHSLGSTLKVL